MRMHDKTILLCHSRHSFAQSCSFSMDLWLDLRVMAFSFDSMSTFFLRFLKLLFHVCHHFDASHYNGIVALFTFQTGQN